MHVFSSKYVTRVHGTCHCVAARSESSQQGAKADLSALFVRKHNSLHKIIM